MYESGTIAIVEAVSPELGNRVQRVRVQLPGTSQELLSKFREKKVDFAAHTATEDGGAVFLNLLGEQNFGHGPTCKHPASSAQFMHGCLETKVLLKQKSGLDACFGCAGNLAFPLLLVGGLFLLSRRQGGVGGPGGSNPMNFGKSKAKFQMEPNTGITFADVAGVEEAKQDFMEVILQIAFPLV